MDLGSAVSSCLGEGEGSFALSKIVFASACDLETVRAVIIEVDLKHGKQKFYGADNMQNIFCSCSVKSVSEVAMKVTGASEGPADGRAMRMIWSQELKRASVQEPVCVKTLYGRISAMGLQYRQDFKALQGVRVDADKGHGFTSNRRSHESLVDPAVLDNSFQLAAFSHSLAGQLKAQIPTAADLNFTRLRHDLQTYSVDFEKNAASDGSHHSVTASDGTLYSAVANLQGKVLLSSQRSAGEPSARCSRRYLVQWMGNVAAQDARIHAPGMALRSGGNSWLASKSVTVERICAAALLSLQGISKKKGRFDMRLPSPYSKGPCGNTSVASLAAEAANLRPCWRR